EKGYYAFSYLLALFGAIAVQKNTRDAKVVTKSDSKE
ncbi:MAG TPA: YiaA/YiaB family inner membrane protein, partial [Niastella sp.]